MVVVAFSISVLNNNIVFGIPSSTYPWVTNLRKKITTRAQQPTKIENKIQIQNTQTLFSTIVVSTCYTGRTLVQRYNTTMNEHWTTLKIYFVFFLRQNSYKK